MCAARVYILSFSLHEHDFWFLRFVDVFFFLFLFCFVCCQRARLIYISSAFIFMFMSL